MLAWILLSASFILAFALTNNTILLGQETNSTTVIAPKLSEDLTHEDRVLIKLTPSGTTAEADVSPRNIKVKVGTTVIWENMLPEKVYVQSKPDENYSEGEILNGTYFFPGESRAEKLDQIGTFIYDGSNGFGSYYVRGSIDVVEDATKDIEIPVETSTNQIVNSATGNESNKPQQQVLFASSSESSGAQSYSNSNLGIALEHPFDWKITNLKNGIQLVKEKNGIYVEVRKHNLDSIGVPLKQYVGDYINERSSIRADFKLLNITETTFSENLPAYKAIYTFLKTENQKDFTTGGMTNKILRIWTFAQDNAYLVAYVADKDNYDLYLPIAEKTIASMEFIPIQSNDDSKDNDDDDDSKDNDDDDDSKDNDDDDDSKDNDDDDDSKDNDDFEDTNGDGDIDCKDTDRRNFKVGPGDPGNLDGDGDGIGCEE